jgi:uncharacterized protein (TIGR02996 family)
VFTIVVDGPQGKQRFEIDTHPTSIGRDSANDLVLLHGAVDRRHARLEIVAAKRVVVDLRSKTGTYVNGERVVGRRVLARDDKLMIGPYSLAILPALDPTTIEPYRPANDTEATLLEDVVAGETASRTVYADWLEEQGDRDRSQLLRLQMAGRTVGGYGERNAARLQELADRTDVAWRTLVARPPIEGCLEFELQCPKDWGSLTPTNEPGVRHCSACEMSALDLTAGRLKDDLAGPFDERMCPRCDIDLGPAEHCPRCGSPVRRRGLIMMGQIRVR